MKNISQYINDIIESDSGHKRAFNLENRDTYPADFFFMGSIAIQLILFSGPNRHIDFNTQFLPGLLFVNKETAITDVIFSPRLKPKSVYQRPPLWSTDEPINGESFIEIVELRKHIYMKNVIYNKK